VLYNWVGRSGAGRKRSFDVWWAGRDSDEICPVAWGLTQVRPPSGWVALVVWPNCRRRGGHGWSRGHGWLLAPQWMPFCKGYMTYTGLSYIMFSTLCTFERPIRDRQGADHSLCMVEHNMLKCNSFFRRLRCTHYVWRAMDWHRRLAGATPEAKANWARGQQLLQQTTGDCCSVSEAPCHLGLQPKTAL
jgi:hypothetical protein